MTNPLNVGYYERRGRQKKKDLLKFLKKVARKKPKNLLSTNKTLGTETWNEVDCLACANCCKKMTPTFKKAEVKRIASHVGMTYKEYFDKYLYIEEDTGDIVNQNTPCQHLNLTDNKCDVYEIRPADCRLFPHFQRKDFNDISETIGDNVSRCPASLIFVEKLQHALEGK